MNMCLTSMSWNALLVDSCGVRAPTSTLASHCVESQKSLPDDLHRQVIVPLAEAEFDHARASDPGPSSKKQQRLETPSGESRGSSR